MNAPDGGAAPKPAGPVASMPGINPVVGVPHAGAPVVGSAIAAPHHETALVRNLHVRKDHSKTAETVAADVEYIILDCGCIRKELEAI